MTKNINNGRKTPPEDEEWPAIWDALAKAENAWLIAGPIFAVVTNWKAILTIIVVVAWLNRPEIIQALSTVVGISQ